MNSDATTQNQPCLRCQSHRVLRGHGGGSDGGDFVLNPEDQRKGWWRLPMGFLNFPGERILCLDCGLVTACTEPVKAKKMLQRHGSDELLARLGLARKLPNLK